MAETNGAAQAEGTNGAAGHVRPTDITQEMQVAYLDYAMSVIVARALPDVRDGLKPVHRRILYAMWYDLSLTHDKPHKKSARIVGEVLGKYHPHGDTAVYDAMVRMAQDFSLRYPLVDGQGNFGSIDGDNAAAMRYTEARLAKISNLMLEDLEKDTVEWHPNFDNTLREPDILPAALPNLLINGSSGIAVGMATNIPPHNLGEVVDALVFVIDRYDKVDDITTEQLMQFIKGPDFPTGGIVYRYREEAKGEEDVDAIAQGYSIGKSRLIMQAKAHFEEISRGRTRIIVTELPYQTNKTALIERIADLVRDGKIEGITDLRDESDRTGMRIVIELNRNVEPKEVLAYLYKYTPLQQTFGMQLLALVDGQPRLLSLKRMLQLFVQHRQEIIRRRSKYDLKRAKERAHIVEGLLRALDILDEVIATIRRSQTVDTARRNLMADFKFSELQAQAILDLQLRRLAALERKRLQEEYDELKKRIAYLEDLLAHPHKMLGVIKDELIAIKDEYADARRTQIVDRTRGALTTHDLLPDQMVWMSMSKDGALRRLPVTKATTSVLKQIGRDSQTALITANTRDVLYVFSRDGRCSRCGIHEIPDDGNSRPVHELTDFQARDAIAAALTLPRERTSDEAGYFCFVTEGGVVKRVAVTDVQTSTAGEFAVINVDSSDRLGWVLQTQGNQEVILVTADGQSIRFSEEEVRSMGLAAGGVGGIKLRGKDKVVFAGVVDPDGELVTATAAGFAKRSALAEYSGQGRNGGGIVAHKVGERTGKLVTAQVVPGHAARDVVVLVTNKGVAKPTPISEIPAMGRSALGKPAIVTADKDTVAAIWRVAGAEPEAGGSSPSPKRKTAVPVEQNELLDAAPAKPRAASPMTLDLKSPAAKTPLVKTQPVVESPAETPVAKTKTVVAPPTAAPAAKSTPAKTQPAVAPTAETPVAKTPPAKAQPPVVPAVEMPAAKSTLVKTQPEVKSPAEPPVAAKPASRAPKEPLAPTFDFVQEEAPKAADDAASKRAAKLQAVVSVNRKSNDKKKG